MTRPDQIDPVIPGKKYMQSYQEFMLKRFDVLGATGQATALESVLKEIQHTIIGQE